jgi:hypothetical protein
VKTVRKIGNLTEKLLSIPPHFFFAMLEQVYIPFGMITEQTDRAAKRIFGPQNKRKLGPLLQFSK